MVIVEADDLGEEATDTVPLEERLDRRRSSCGDNRAPSAARRDGAEYVDRRVVKTTLGNAALVSLDEPRREALPSLPFQVEPEALVVAPHRKVELRAVAGSVELR